MGVVKAVKLVFGIVGFLILAVIGLGAYLYFTDYAAQASITDKGTDAQGDYVVVTPKLWPAYHYAQHLDSNTAAFVCKGYQVDFHVNTKHYLVYDASHTLVYDSDQGLVNQGAALRCAGSNAGGGIFG